MSLLKINHLETNSDYLSVNSWVWDTTKKIKHNKAAISPLINPIGEYTSSILHNISIKLNYLNTTKLRSSPLTLIYFNMKIQ